MIYLPASAETARLNFQSFKRACLALVGSEAGLEGQKDWMGLLSSIAIAAQKRPDLVIVLDNFSVLCEADETLPFTIRTFWQSGIMAHSNLKLILSGSNIMRMTDLTRGTPALAQHALAGCAPQLIDVGPLSLQEARQHFQDWSAEACIAAYAIFGGVPANLLALAPEKGLRTNIIDLLLTPNGRLVDEAISQLTHELRDIKVYASILRAISNGYRESGEIKSFIMGGQTGMSISAYLEKLRNMRLIRDVRALDADPKSRYIRFAITDPLTRFYNLFVQPNRVAIDRGEGADIFDSKIRHQLGDYMLVGFEDICRDFVRNHGHAIFGFRPDGVGQTWGNGFDIAIAGRLTDKTPFFGACAWSTRPVGEAGAEYLIQQVKRTDYVPENVSNDGRIPPAKYVMFSRAGFTEDVRGQVLQAHEFKLVTPEELVRAG